MCNDHVETTYHRRSERAVQPPTTLTNQLSGRLGDICLGFTRLDVCQCPLVIRLRDQLETEDTILGQEHVLREDVHSVDTLGTQTVRKRVVAVEILVEGPTEDRAVPVG